ncbi:X-Pro aminopeptidase [Roseovarius sp. 22II1-1F6A]|nr:X-Pro aminopeptidase [Roseovarius sp. 22II1-1F6A]
MFQSFDSPTRPADGPPRLAALRAALAQAGLDGFLVPRADAHQGEYVAPRDERLAWLTGFTGSAGFCAVLPHIAGVFIDGRYRVAVKDQVDLDAFTPVPWPETSLADWLRAELPSGGTIGFDPWLHAIEQIDTLTNALEGSGITLSAVANPVDAIWPDQPAPPAGAVRLHPEELAGESARSKIDRLAARLRDRGHDHAVITLPDSIAWLFNIRGSDIARNPVPHGFAILHADGTAALFMDPAKLDASVRAALHPLADLHDPAAFEPALTALTGPVLLDRGTAPMRVRDLLTAAQVVPGQDPCILPKARKNPAEIAGMEAAHLRDARAMIRFLAWLDAAVPQGTLTEIGAVQALEAFRAEDPTLREISFDTICGAGPHGAIVHYRVTHDTDRAITPGDLLLIDSGGQYADGTTDITRTVATGPVTADQRACFTSVLRGMIDMSRLRFPKGLAGQHLDAVARAPLWAAGLDYDHGTGHGVGAYLSVHEGPQRLSRTSDVALEPGMILSNEPGYYREGAWGIRIENLIHVAEAPPLAGGDAARRMLEFRTLTWVPIDRRLIDAEALGADARGWLDAYHADIRTRLASTLDEDVQAWLIAATEPL